MICMFSLTLLNAAVICVCFLCLSFFILLHLLRNQSCLSLIFVTASTLIVPAIAQITIAAVNFSAGGTVSFV